jgi:arylsulfatase A-like enzyme
MDRNGHTTADASGGRDNLLLVTVDSLRADHCGFAGDDRGLTPTLDRLAREGVVYDDAIAPGPRTPSSMPVAFTGQFNRPTQFEYGDWEHRYDRISEHMQRHRTLPERLQALGYTTVGVTVNPWTHQTGFDTGFDTFHAVTGDAAVDDPRSAPLLYALDKIVPRTRLGETFQWHTTRDWFVQWPHYYDVIERALRETPEPYFLWVFLLDPHQPYLAPRRFRAESSLAGMYHANLRESTTDGPTADLSASVRTYLERAYRDAVRSTDGFLKRLLGDAPGEPTVVVHADHGDAFGEHGTYGHRDELYEENLRVPLVVHDGRHDGQVADPVSLRALPTLVKALADPDRAFDPRSVTREAVMATTEDGQRYALRGSRWKLVINGETTALYDLVGDPDESTDVAADRPEMRDRLLAAAQLRYDHALEEVAVAEAATAVTGDGRLSGRESK